MTRKKDKRAMTKKKITQEAMDMILAVVLWLLRDDRVVPLHELCSALNGQVTEKQLLEEVIKRLADDNACEVEGDEHQPTIRLTAGPSEPWRKKLDQMED